MNFSEALEIARSVYWIKGDQYGFVLPEMSVKVSAKKAEIFERLVLFERKMREIFGLKSVQVRMTSDPFDTAVHIHIHPAGEIDKLVFSISAIADVIGYYFVDEWSSTILQRGYVDKRPGRFDQYQELVGAFVEYIIEKLPGYELLDVDLYNVNVYDNGGNTPASQIDKQVIYHFFFTENTW